MQTIQEIYQKNISPLPDEEKLQIATLILEDVTGKTASGNGAKPINEAAEQNGEAVHALTLLAQIKLEGAPSDLAERHDYYAHGKLEN